MEASRIPLVGVLLGVQVPCFPTCSSTPLLLPCCSHSRAAGVSQVCLQGHLPGEEGEAGLVSAGHVGPCFPEPAVGDVAVVAVDSCSHGVSSCSPSCPHGGGGGHKRDSHMPHVTG